MFVGYPGASYLFVDADFFDVHSKSAVVSSAVSRHDLPWLPEVGLSEMMTFSVSSVLSGGSAALLVSQ